MKLKSSTLFLELIDFFSILFPGVILTNFLMSFYDMNLLGIRIPSSFSKSLVQWWIIFLLVSHIIGYFSRIVASLLLDDFGYNRFRRLRFQKKKYNLCYQATTAIRDQYIDSNLWVKQLVSMGKLKGKGIETIIDNENIAVIDTYSWAKMFLYIKSPETIGSIEKLEAESRLLRSLVIIFLVIGILLLVEAEWIVAACIFVVLLVCWYGYEELRYRAELMTYDFIITVHHLEKPSEAEYQSQVRDNRAKFTPSVEVIAPYQEKISLLTQGLRADPETLAIPTNETWEVSNLPRSETLYCLTGKCVANIKTNDNEVKLIISPNALIPLPSKSSFEVSNQQQERLLFLVLNN